MKEQGSWQRIRGWATRLFTWAIVLGMLLYGLWSYPLALFGPERALIPGDLGDARFNNYILEHFHRYITGREAHYWDAPFLYPYKNTIALSDNLLGSAPIYSAFRGAGFNRESAFQLWILAVFALNYIACFLALWQWSRRPVLAACGAFVFAFGIHTIGHLYHAQVFPRFMVPLAFLFCWQWLSTGRMRHLILTGLVVVFQFYCGIYLGLMLCYALGALVAAHVLLHWRRIRSLADRRSVLGSAGVVVLLAALLIPLMVPYIQVATSLGTRHFEEVVASIPRPASYFFTHPAALNWRSLSHHSQFAFEGWRDHFHFMGAVPWAAMLLAPILLWRSRLEPATRSVLLTVLLAWGSSTLLCLRIGDFTLWKIVFHVPGFSALRSIDRILNVQAMFFVVIMVMVCAALSARRIPRMAMTVLLPVFVLFDNRVDVNELTRFDKYTAQHLVWDVERDIQQQRDDRYRAIAYQRALPVTDPATWHERTIETHLTVMLAAQHLGVPVVNACTGSYPGNYLDFFGRMDRPALNEWCAFNSIGINDIQLVSNTGEEMLDRDTIWIMADNGRYVATGPDPARMARADRIRPRDREVYLRVQLGGQRLALVTHTGAFLCAELEEGDRLSGTAESLGDFGTFTEVRLAGGHVALKADNGKYVTRDTLTDVLHARADTIGRNEAFRFIQPATLVGGH